MSKVIIALLIVAFLATFFLLFCIALLSLALLIFGRKVKKKPTSQPEIKSA